MSVPAGRMGVVLQELHVAGLGVVEDISLRLAPGLNVLTGETGAGKTLITVGLALALGARASAASVRAGERSASVEALFVLSPGVAGQIEALREEDEAPEHEVEVVLARTVAADGRGSARLNGRLAPLASLSAVGDRLVEIHGQSQSSRLLAPAAQAALLDRFAGPAHLEVVEAYRRAHASLRSAQASLRAIDRDARERERERDLLRYQIREIEAANVSPGEMALLAREESRLAHAERILELAGSAEQAVGDEGGAVDRLGEAAAAAQAIAAVDASAEALEAHLRSAAAEAADALGELRAYRESIDADPSRLQGVQERARELRGLERKYGDAEEGILAYLEDAGTRLASLEGEDAERATLARAVEELSATVSALAVEVTAGRTRSAPALEEVLTREIRALGMPGAEVMVELAPELEPSPGGAERVAFEFSGGRGQPRLPLARAASGGELSRVTLAWRAVMADLDAAQTLVFDEVDAGIGGRTAVAVAERLARVAERRQVLVVTHLAQIAARADRHFLVSKNEGRATVEMLDGERRVEELARMLSGRTGKASLAHARDLIDAPAG
jgi:DNA repair protein RecN (Recombination protein N)